MKIEDYQAKISLFYETNPHLTHDELAVVLTADLMYKDLPDDLPEFRKRYAHLDPSIVEGAHEGITFLRIAEDEEPTRVVKDRLNAYLNVKFHDITNAKGYEENAFLFRERSEIASQVIEEILLRADFPKEIATVLQEKEEVLLLGWGVKMPIPIKSRRYDEAFYAEMKGKKSARTPANGDDYSLDELNEMFGLGS